MNRSLIMFGLLLTLLATAVPAAAVDPDEVYAQLGPVELLGRGADRLDLSLGAFEAFNGSQTNLMVAAEWHFGHKLFFVGPLLGGLLTTDREAMAYVGLYADFKAGPLVITPQTGFGAYDEGNGKDLGGTFEFISALSASWQLENRQRIGARFMHISNAEIHDKNPGADLLLLHWSIPF